MLLAHPLCLRFDARSNLVSLSSFSRSQDRLSELDLDDLHSAEASKEVPLDMNVQDRQRYFEGRSAAEEVAKVTERDEAVSSKSPFVVRSFGTLVFQIRADLSLVWPVPWTGNDCDSRRI